MAEQRSKYVTAPDAQPTKVMCACGRPIGDVEYHNGRGGLRYYNGKFSMLIYWGVVCCQVCGREREFHGVRTCTDLDDEPTTEMPPC